MFTENTDGGNTVNVTCPRTGTDVNDVGRDLGMDFTDCVHACGK